MQDHFFNLPLGAVRLMGPLGRGLELTIANRLKRIDYRRLVDPFRFRRENCTFRNPCVARHKRRGTSRHDPDDS